VISQLLVSILLLSFGISDQYTVNLYFEQHEEALTELFEIQVFPHPFNPTITIPFDLPLNSNITIGIYNVKGQLVRNLHSSNISAGFHSAQWSSLTNAGQKVPSGMYIVRLNAVSTDGRKSFQKSQKIALLK
jgi:hypothetical protein